MALTWSHVFQCFGWTQILGPRLHGMPQTLASAAADAPQTELRPRPARCLPSAFPFRVRLGHPWREGSLWAQCVVFLWRERRAQDTGELWAEGTLSVESPFPVLRGTGQSLSERTWGVVSTPAPSLASTWSPPAPAPGSPCDLCKLNEQLGGDARLPGLWAEELTCVAGIFVTVSLPLRRPRRTTVFLHFLG